MTPTFNRTDVVKAFRRELDAAAFGLGQVTDNELNSWLFSAGSDRMHLLQWCLGQLNPELRKLFQNCDEREAEKRTVEQIKALGLALNQDVILGFADENGQMLMWGRLLKFFKIPSEFRQNLTACGNYSESVAKRISSTLVMNKDLSDLMSTKLKLVPAEIRIVPVPLKKVEDELNMITLRLEELQDALINSSSDDNTDDEGSDEVSKINHLQTADEYKEVFFQHLRKIKECYQHLEQTVFPAIKKQAATSIADVFGSYIENLADSITAFVQMLRDTEDIFKMSSELRSSNIPVLRGSRSLELSQCISKCHSCVSEILSLWRIHNMV